VKWVLAFLLSLSAAFAQDAPPGSPHWPYGPPFTPCPYFVAGWAITFSPTPAQPISTVMYDQNTQLLYVIFNNNFPSAYYPVPISIIQTFSQSRNNPMQIYQSYVVPRYEALFLEEVYNCPILNENGVYIYTN
jgi:KTSC domain